MLNSDLPAAAKVSDDWSVRWPLTQPQGPKSTLPTFGELTATQRHIYGLPTRTKPHGTIVLWTQAEAARNLRAVSLSAEAVQSVADAPNRKGPFRLPTALTMESLRALSKVVEPCAIRTITRSCPVKTMSLQPRILAISGSTTTEQCIEIRVSSE